MSTSFVEFRGHGFWARDPHIELWLCLLASEVRRLEDSPPWLRTAAEDWHVQATVGMIGCVSAGLDEHLTDDARVTDALRFAERALEGLRARGPVLDVAWLNSLGTGGEGASYGSSPPAEGFLAVGEAFIRLLRGEIEWDAGTSPVL